jgi:hypothetical protein
MALRRGAVSDIGWATRAHITEHYANSSDQASEKSAVMIDGE